jgi:hypothetical protein
MKTCSVCKIEKSFSDFHKHHSRKDGHVAVCKICLSTRKKTRTPNSICLICHTHFYANPARLKKNQGKYCSMKCQSIAKKKVRPTLTCENCGNEFPYSIDNRGRKFCSRKCSQIHRRKPKTEISTKQCKICKKRKEVKYFHHNRASWDGYVGTCKSCTRTRNVERVQSIRASSRKHRQKHPEEGRKKHWKRQANLLWAPYEDITFEEIYLRDGGICQICHKKVLAHGKSKVPKSKTPSLDHIIPVSHPDFKIVGHVRTNVRLAHFGCNAGRCASAGDAQYLLFG